MAVESGILLDAFRIPQADAAAYLRGKKLTPSGDFTEVWGRRHNDSFAVAQMLKLDMLQDVLDELDKAVAGGGTLQDFKNALIPRMKSAGWWGKVPDPKDPTREIQLGSPHRLQTIFDTNVQAAYGAGRWKQLQDLKKSRPYGQYVAVLDNVTRPAHRALHGKVFRLDDPATAVIAPPNGYRCRCTWVSVGAAEVEAERLEVEPGPEPVEREVVVSRRTGEMKTVQGIRLKNGMEFYPDAGFDHAPARADDSTRPDKKKYDPGLFKAFEEAAKEVPPPPPLEGLVKRMPVKTNKDVENLLRAFDKENPGIFQLGFRSLSVRSTTSYLMQTNRLGDITISSAAQGEFKIRPMADLKAALQKIRAGQALTFNEEYSIESLWHEICHTRSKGWDFIPPYSGAGAVMETLNQFVARHSYHEFMAKLGGVPTHQAEIIERGYGYGSLVRNFRTMIRTLGFEEKMAYEAMQSIAFEVKWRNIPGALASLLSSLKGEPKLERQIIYALGMLHERDPGRYLARLDELFRGLL